MELWQAMQKVQLNSSGTNSTRIMLPTIEYKDPGNNSTYDVIGDVREIRNSFKKRTNINVSDFTGKVIIQASLSEIIPTDDEQWFDVYEFIGIDKDTKQDYGSIDDLRNFSYMRVKIVNFAAGRINYLKLGWKAD